MVDYKPKCLLFKKKKKLIQIGSASIKKLEVGYAFLYQYVNICKGVCCFSKPMIIFTTLRIRQDFLPSMQDFKNVPVCLCRLWTCQHSCITICLGPGQLEGGRKRGRVRFPVLFNSMINSSWSKDILVLLSLLFSEEGKRSTGEGKLQSAIVDSSTGRILLLEVEEFICCIFRRWEIECQQRLTNYDDSIKKHG